MSFYRRSNPPPPPPTASRGPTRGPSQYGGRPTSIPPGQAYQQYGRPKGPPPGADQQLWAYFQSVDEDGSGAISPDELSKALVNGDWTSFDRDTVRMLMGLFDTDRSGTITFQEFSGLWKYIADWQKVFRHFDRDQSGSIDGAELAAALRQFGYTLSPTLLSLIEQKYSSFPTAYGAPGGINFDRFVRACVAVKTLTEAFQKQDQDQDGWIQIKYEDFMKIVLSAP
ncbi:hypothetical protein M407DRAFT_194720 [Tulasnella calospora MUT 4182]|uniref:EF-hand domain-containing protein n=1 Tax=Tulasnella calospora MUT 4182 TaxID=1051891 RepID=A0A0C3M0G0_9AGAM|nr:hypothetical protein M407DRAFT_194720 [Tulasnella calospora MUT 4182]